MQEELSHLDFFYKYRNYYTVILLALLTAFSGIIMQFYESQYVFILTSLPISMVVLSFIGTKSIERYYTRTIEAITLIAKIENLLGLDQPLSSELGKPLVTLFPLDTQFMVERYIKSRFDKQCDTSEKFIRRVMKKGDHKWANLTFKFFMFLGFALIVLTIIIELINIGILLK
jgi:hypothetical protein